MRSTHKAMEHCNRKNSQVKAINFCGGVSCNNALYNKLEKIAEIYEVPLIRSPPKLCTDNAAMIAWMGWELLNCG